MNGSKINERLKGDPQNLEMLEEQLLEEIESLEDEYRSVVFKRTKVKRDNDILKKSLYKKTNALSILMKEKVLLEQEISANKRQIEKEGVEIEKLENKLRDLGSKIEKQRLLLEKDVDVEFDLEKKETECSQLEIECSITTEKKQELEKETEVLQNKVNELKKELKTLKVRLIISNRVWMNQCKRIQ